MSEQQYVNFRLNNEEYGIPIHQVQEILHVQEPTKMPQSANFIEGIINLRNNIIPVIDLKKRFYQAGSTPDENSRIIVVDLGQQTVGIIADEVLEVLTLANQMIDPPPFLLKQMAAGCGVTGVGKLENRLVILLNLAEVFTSEEKMSILEAIA